MKLVNVVEGDAKVPFSLATSPRCRGMDNSFPWLAPFTHDPNMMLNVLDASLLSMTQLAIESRILRPLANTLLTMY